ncbi:MAG: murein L,D-transpeptidase [Actinobacteria bacterium]|nr:MAG: murein L,D-transpeptidase [Actinomycetota bacterium]RIK07147.1 MAG: hypothetical protein DCC48_05005 [Acidobacteriota bacterium]
MNGAFKRIAAIVVAVAAVAVGMLVLTASGGRSELVTGSAPVAEDYRTQGLWELQREVPVRGAWAVEVATATVPMVVAYEQVPDPDFEPSEAVIDERSESEIDRSSVEHPENPSAPPVPREGYASAVSRKVDGGWEFDNPTYFGNPLTFLVNENHGEWLKVVLPVRPNETEGWIRAADVTLSSHDFHAKLTLSQHRLEVYQDDQLIASTGVVAGKASTPTPLGRYFITDKVPKNAGGAYGPWILSLNGFSETLNEFNGGIPVIAMHGTNQPELIGSDASNGCIRMPNDVVELLANTVPLGTPVEIYA